MTITTRLAAAARFLRLTGLAIFAPLALASAFAAPALAAPPTPTGTPAMVTSDDGTRIAYESRGTGPALVIVGGALSDRTGARALADALASHFTVVTWDRRGRGDSGDTAPYAVQREIEDLAAVIDGAGGAAYVYGTSSGAALALRAAAVLDGKVTKLALYEAPWDDSDGAADAWRALTTKIDALLAADRRGDAITAFMQFVGMPDDALAGMKTSPAWPGMLAMAPTLAYDNAVLGADRRVPVDVAARVTMPVLVLDGAASTGPMSFMATTADTLAAAMPDATRRTVAGQGHQAEPAAIAPILRAFFR